MDKREPIAWMVYTVDGQSAYVTDNPSDIKEGQSAYALYPGPFEQVLLTEEEISAMAQKTWKPSVYYDAFSLLGTDGLVALARAVEKASWKKNHGQA